MGQWWLRDWRVGAHLQRCVGDFWRSVSFVVFMFWLLSVLMICLGYAEGMELYKTRRWKIFPSSARQCFVLPSQQCSPNARSHALRRRVIQKLKMKEAEAMQVLLLVPPLNSKVPLSVSTLTYADTVTSAPLLTALLVTCGCSLEDCCHPLRSICFYAWISNDQASGRGRHEESLTCEHFLDFCCLFLPISYTSFEKHVS